MPEAVKEILRQRQVEVRVMRVAAFLAAAADAISETGVKVRS